MEYAWVKALHLIAVMSWMAGLLYLPRLFVYHAMVEAESVRAQTFKLMERRLLKAIMNPASIGFFNDNQLANAIITPDMKTFKPKVNINF